MSDRLVVGYQRLCGTPEGQPARLFFDIQLFHPTFPERSGRLGNIIFWQNNSRSVTLSFGLTRLMLCKLESGKLLDNFLYHFFKIGV